jgi:hypothetical protein
MKRILGITLSLASLKAPFPSIIHQELFRVMQGMA